MEHIKNLLLKRQTGKIFLLSRWIDVSSIGCTINYTNTLSLRELSLGVLICLDMVSINSPNIDSYKNQASTVELFLTVKKFLTVSKPSLDCWEIIDSQEIFDSLKTKFWQSRNFWQFKNPTYNNLDTFKSLFLTWSQTRHSISTVSNPKSWQLKNSWQFQNPWQSQNPRQFQNQSLNSLQTWGLNRESKDWQLQNQFLTVKTLYFLTKQSHIYIKVWLQF
jgi:hypothetical protein